MLYSDISNAKLFYELFKHKVKWNPLGGGWYIYNGKRWQRDRSSAIKRFALECHDELFRQLQEFDGDEDQQEKFARHVKSSAQNGKLEAMLEVSKAYLGENQNNFDSKEELLNCQNGTLNFQTGEFGKIINKDTDFEDKIMFDPDDLITKISNINFNVEAKCPLWDKFLEDIFLGDYEIINFMQKVIGYCLTASTKEQSLFILYGIGRNGKSLFLDTISEMLGDYAVNCPSNTLIKKTNTGGIPNDVASLKGSRFVTAVESNQNVTLDEALIKQLTGGDKITARFLHKEYFEFRPTFKIFIATNHKPNIRGTDTGIWRRIKMIPFDMRITDQQEDRRLGEKLRKEIPGIFIWAYKGWCNWMKEGLVTPQKIVEAICDYREEEDDLGRFIRDYCIIIKDGYIPVNDFKDKFKRINNYSKSQKIICEYMRRINIKKVRKYVKGTQIISWEGLRWVESYDSNFM